MYHTAYSMYCSPDQIFFHSLGFYILRRGTVSMMRGIIEALSRNSNPFPLKPHLYGVKGLMFNASC